jgi:CubicO group peptidase (beta-lactamase class C family)
MSVTRAAVVVATVGIVSALSSSPSFAQTRAPQAAARPQSPYFPDRFGWEHKQPADAGMAASLVDEAVKLAVASENQASRDLFLAGAAGYGREPFDTPIGPVKARGPASGVVLKGGYIVAEWGEPSRADMTFSVTKTFLTTVVGLAWQKGLIRDVKDFARDYMPAGDTLFESEHNRTITWDHLLRQTSDWQGTLWDKPDWADRPEGQRPAEWPNRPLREPGTYFKYNDVRVNVLALAALHVHRRPLPEVLREEIMDPIGASSTWRWHGYDNSWIELDGRKVQSVSGGGHWGGGMFINAYDMARFGYLFLRNGKWKDRTLVSEKWIEMARTPGPANVNYGYANWYLNTERKPLPAAPATAVHFVGNGNNYIYIDWDNDLVVVARWVDSARSLNAIVEKLIASARPAPTTASR